MKRLALALSLLIALALPARAEGIEVGSAWARATVPTAEAGAVYVGLRNAGQPDRLLGASTPAAERVELHVTLMEGDMMAMRPVELPMKLESGQSLAMAPMGTHLMLLGLHQGLAEGASFPLYLEFEKAGRVEVQVTVAAPGASSAP